MTATPKLHGQLITTAVGVIQVQNEVYAVEPTHDDLAN
ncbi:hypothetical protein BH10PSE11_BH10PSE11_28300 [soil metagenome]